MAEKISALKHSAKMKYLYVKAKVQKVIGKAIIGVSIAIGMTAMFFGEIAQGIVRMFS